MRQVAIDQNNMDYAVERYHREGRAIVQQNGRPHSNYEQIVPYNRHSPYPGTVPIQVQMAADKEAQHHNIKATQNAQAILQYNKLDKGKVREGRHAAAVAQLHQNDLHNVSMPIVPHESKQNGAVAPVDRSKNYIKQHLNLQSKFARAQTTTPQDHFSGRAYTNQDSDMTTSFDPMKDRHLWTMWRTAVNGRIVDEVRQLEKRKKETRPVSSSSSSEAIVPGMYGKALVMPPLKRYIRYDDDSRAIAHRMSNLSQGRLETAQFVYYGLPRVYVSHRK